MDSEIDKSAATSGLFGLITAKLEDAHDASVAGQGRRMTDNARQAAINDLRTTQDEIAILLPAIGLITPHISTGTNLLLP